MRAAAFDPLAWADRLESGLRRDLLDAWWPRAADPAGGFHQSFDRAWNPRADQYRFVVHQARHVWSACAAAEAFPEAGDHFRGLARHGLAHLLERFADPATGAFAWMIPADPAGPPLPEGDVRRTYGLAFALYGLAAAARTLGDADALAAAQRLFGFLEACVHDPVHAGYAEAVAPDGSPLPPPADHPPAKSHNTSLHLLEAFLELHGVWPDPAVARRRDEMADLLAGPFVRAEGCSAEALTPDLKPLGDHTSFGHDLEAVHLLIAWAEQTGRPVPAGAVAMTEFAQRRALDSATGGVWHVGTIDGEPVDRRKIWWVQAEAMFGFAEAARALGAPAWPLAVEVADWIFRRHIDPVHGGWFGTLDAFGGLLDGGAKGHAWKAMYHETRAMLGTARAMRAAFAPPAPAPPAPPRKPKA